MCCESLRGVLIGCFLIIYSFGSAMAGLFGFLFLEVKLLPITMLSTETKEEYWMRYFAVGLGCYTITYTICCQANVFHCTVKHPIRGAVNLCCALFLIFGLAALVLYSGMKWWASLIFCINGVLFAFVFIMIASAYRKEFMEEWVDLTDLMEVVAEMNRKKRAGFTSYIKEDQKIETVV